VVLGGGGYNPWTVIRCWSGLWGRLSGRAIPATLPPPAQELLGGLRGDLIDEDEVPEAWITTLADVPNSGPVRPEVARLPGLVLRDPCTAGIAGQGIACAIKHRLLNWLGSLRQIEAFEDADFDAALVAEMERAAPASRQRLVRFSTPTFKEYESTSCRAAARTASRRSLSLPAAAR
jgi:hypothetical protein